MASVTSTTSGNNVVYTITDEAGNTLTVTAPPPGQAVTFSGTVLNDGQNELARLVLMLVANGNSPRPQVIPGTVDSFYS